MRRVSLLSLLAACPLVFAACATTTSVSNFKGAQREVAQTVADLQSDLSAGDHKKICERDLSAAVVNRLGGQTKCESTIKDQIAEIDNTELEVEAVKVAQSSATATVKSVYGGKKLAGASVALVREGARWKIDSLTAPPKAPTAG